MAATDSNHNAAVPFIKITSTILTVLDDNLARMPPGEMTPVIDQQRVEPPE